LRKAKNIILATKNGILAKIIPLIPKDESQLGGGEPSMVVTAI